MGVHSHGATCKKIVSPMNNSFSLGRWFRSQRSIASAGLVAVTLLSAIFWAATARVVVAQGMQCTLCHKRTTTLMLACDSLDYRRHIDHGDTMGACGVTPTANP